MKRFIRYLYEYGQGKKVRNVGFVNVEQSGEESTLHIHGKGLRLAGGDALGLYLCWEEDGGLVGTYQGDIAFMGPAVNYRLHYTKEDTNGAKNYDTVGGILLKDRNGRTFAAMWEDAPVDVERLPCREKVVRQEETERGSAADAVSGSAADEKELVTGAAPQPSAPERESVSDEAPEAVSDEVLEPGADEKEPGSDEAPEAVSDEILEPGAPEREPVPDEAPEAVPDVVLEPGAPERESALDEAPEAVPDVVPQTVSDRADPDPHAMDAGAESDFSGRADADVRIQAEDRGETCPFKRTKIQRSDIARLPRCEWRLANNHFLLHGYNNYRHLVLLDDGRVLRLGVPGIYHVKEARAASGFGFPEFIHAYEIRQAADEEEWEEEETFGYWCRQVRRPRE